MKKENLASTNLDISIITIPKKKDKILRKTFESLDELIKMTDNIPKLQQKLEKVGFKDENKK